MKHLLLLSVVIALLSASCGNNNAAVSGTPASSGSDDGQFEGDGSLTYTIEGKKTAIKDYLVKGSNRQMALFVNKAKDDATSGTVQVSVTNQLTHDLFRFKVADKGTTNILHYQPTLGGSKAEADYLAYDTGKNCYADSVTVTITALDAKHIAGTFSGTYKREDGSKIVTVTDGSFDVPVNAGM